MKNRIFFCIFMPVWIIIIIINFIWPKQVFSEEENRMLATIPNFSFNNFLSGDYLNGVNSYINDHFAFRNTYLHINSWWEINVMGKKENNGVYIGKDGYLFEKFRYTETEKEKVNDNIQTISSFSQDMNKLNISTYLLIIPNSIYINSDKLPDGVEVENQESIINYIYSKSKDTININVTKKVKEENETNPLYFKTDHHFNSDGAYVAYSEFCKAAQIKATPLENFEKVNVSNDFLGTFDSKAQILNQKSDQIFAYQNEINNNLQEGIYDKEKINTIFNEKYLAGKDKYSYFLNGNNSKVVIKTKVSNDKKLLVIKDSYAHIMAQFLCQNYKEIHFLDPRYTNFDYAKYAKENGITDVVFIYNVSNFTTDTNLNKII